MLFGIIVDSVIQGTFIIVIAVYAKMVFQRIRIRSDFVQRVKTVLFGTALITRFLIALYMCFKN